MAARDPLENQDLLKKTPWNFSEYYNPQVIALLEQAKRTLDVTARTQVLLKAQSMYEPAQSTMTIVSQYEVSYLKNGLAGMVTTWHYFSIPSLALIGKAQ